MGVIEERQPSAASAHLGRISGKIDTSTPYVTGKVVSRLEMDSRWALVCSVCALVAERDALKEKLETRLTDAPHVEVRNF